MESSDPKLGSDMVFEILSRSSLKTLANCRLVSKECNLLTYESAFLDLHSRRTKSLSGFFIQTNNTSASFVSPENPNCKFSLDFLPSSSSVTIKASSVQGLLVCVEKKRDPQHYVCKPVTKEWELIPNPKTKYFTEAMGIKVLRSNPLEYKIVRLSRPKNRLVGKYNCLNCEIYDSVVGKWRRIEQVKLPCDEQLISWYPAISACGKIHWKTNENNVLAFDVDGEKYSLFSLPSPVYEKQHYDVHLTDYEGKLGVIFKNDSFFELWTMEIYKKKEWRKRVRVSTEDFKEEQAQSCNNPVAFCNTDVALVPGVYSLLLFKFKNGISIDEVKLDSCVMPQGFFPFRSDFELCNMKNELFNKYYSNNSERRRNKSKPREEEQECLNEINRRCFSVSPTFVVLLLLFFVTFVCFVLDF